MIVLDICLSDIPKERITTGRNGKKYCKLCVSEMRQPDKWGNSHTVYMGQSKEERMEKAEKVWVGKGTTYAPADPEPKAVPPVKFNQPGDLPF